MKMNHGDFRSIVTRDMYRMIEKIINAKSNRRLPYYILVNVKPYYQGVPAVSKIVDGKAVQNPAAYRMLGGQLSHSRIIVLEPKRKPKVPQLGTLLWRVDNRKGEVKLVWALPIDVPNPVEDSDNAGEVAKIAAESAKKFGVPLIWN